MVDKSLNYGRHHIRRFCAQVDTKVALDLGAGTGDDLASIRAVHPNARAIAVEVYEPYVRSLGANGYEVVSCNIERDRLPFDDGSVDLVVANQVLEHVKEVFWILHECSRVLRVGGSFVIGVPNLAAAHNRLLLMLGRQPTQIRNWSAHVRGYTKHDLVELFQLPFPGGYRLAAHAGSNFYPLPAPLARPAAALWPGGAWGLFCRMEKLREYDGEYLRWPIEAVLETNFYLGAAEGVSAS